MKHTKSVLMSGGFLPTKNVQITISIPKRISQYLLSTTNANVCVRVYFFLFVLSQLQFYQRT